jgi:hypothetical protein
MKQEHTPKYYTMLVYNKQIGTQRYKHIHETIAQACVQFAQYEEDIIVLIEEATQE